MIALNHMLVPHDFGDTSKTAMDYAITLAQVSVRCSMSCT